jgi:hypothetical protein
LVVVDSSFFSTQDLGSLLKNMKTVVMGLLFVCLVKAVRVVAIQ